MKTPVSIDQGQIAAFCRKHHIVKLSLFGSVLREDFNPASDVDVLVEFQNGHTPGWGIIRMEQELSELLGGRKVDLVTENFLNWRIRDRVLADAQVQYAQE